MHKINNNKKKDRIQDYGTRRSNINVSMYIEKDKKTNDKIIIYYDIHKWPRVK